MQDSDKKYSLREEFSHEFDEWMKNTPLKKRQIDGGYFIVGKTSEALKRIGVRESNIYWRKQKVQFIMDEHPEIDGQIIKDIPSIVENPIVVMKSQTHDDSITMFGDVKAGDFYVMVAVNLTPKPSGRTEAEFSLIASAYGRSDNNAKSLIEKSEVLYMAKKSRADTLLTSLGVQFPSDQQAYDSTYGSITYSDGKVNIEGKKISEILKNPDVYDTAYLSAVNSGDMETAQRMVDEESTGHTTVGTGAPDRSKTKGEGAQKRTPRMEAFFS